MKEETEKLLLSKIAELSLLVSGDPETPIDIVRCAIKDLRFFREMQNSQLEEKRQIIDMLLAGWQKRRNR